MYGGIYEVWWIIHDSCLLWSRDLARREGSTVAILFRTAWPAPKPAVILTPLSLARFINDMLVLDENKKGTVLHYQPFADWAFANRISTYPSKWASSMAYSQLKFPLQAWIDRIAAMKSSRHRTFPFKPSPTRAIE